MKLYPFQQDCVEELLIGFKKHKAQCLSWYTGAGKTNVFVELCSRLIKENPKVKIGISAYLTSEIKEQVSERISSFKMGNSLHTVFSGLSRDLSKNIFVFNPQSIYWTPLGVKLDYLIVDEGHAGLNTGCLMLRKIIKDSCKKDHKVLIVSATPWDILSLKEFKNTPVLKRPLDQGIKDGLITDFKFHAEEAQITFEEKDFNRKGDLIGSSTQKKMTILKSACIGKLEYIINNYDKELGKKVLVICPPGNITEIARECAKRFGGLAFLQNEAGRDRRGAENTSENLKIFQEDANKRFLFVVNKCQVGFDMPELTSVVDLTMSRNIKVLAQRCGRIARKHNSLEKHYFYVYDQSLMKDRLEWLISTMIDFCLGAYDGWTTKSVKYRKTVVRSQWTLREPFSTTLKEVISALRGDGLIKNQRTLSYISAHALPTKWTLSLAIEESKKWSSRTEMWAKQPGLYKWFRLNAKEEMDNLFPLRNKSHTEASVIAVLKKCKYRSELRSKYRGAYYWIVANKRDDLRDKYLAKSRSTKKWGESIAKEKLSSIRTWAHIRCSYPGLRRWMHNNGGESFWKEYWLNLPAQKGLKDGRRKRKLLKGA